MICLCFVRLASDVRRKSARAHSLKQFPEKVTTQTRKWSLKITESIIIETWWPMWTFHLHSNRMIRWVRRRFLSLLYQFSSVKSEFFFSIVRWIICIVGTAFSTGVDDVFVVWTIHTVIMFICFIAFVSDSFNRFVSSNSLFIRLFNDHEIIIVFSKTTKKPRWKEREGEIKTSIAFNWSFSAWNHLTW